MAYRNVLTGVWEGNFSYFTRKQANVVYSNYKRGNIKMTRKQANEMYNLVENTEADYSLYQRVCDFIFKKRYDLAQALLDGHDVRMGTTSITHMYTVPQDFDDLFKADALPKWVKWFEIIIDYDDDDNPPVGKTYFFEEIMETDWEII